MLKIRADALRTNLVKVQRFLATAPSRKVPLQELEEAMRKLKARANEVDTAAYSVKTYLEDELREEVPTSYSDLQKRALESQDRLAALLEKVKKLGADAAEIKTSLEALLSKVQEMKLSCFGIDPNESAGPVISQDLKTRTNEPLNALKKVLPPARPDKQAWSTYYREAAIPSQAIFAEYVDFLGGMALRDIGFDEGISRVAEDLIRTYKTNRVPPFPWLALPAGQHSAVAKTLASIVRVGFPEWTIWALPFTAHAFWHVIARYDLDAELREQLTASLSENIPERFQACLADAFATYTMGPAFAYAAFYLVLNPLLAYAPDELGGSFEPDVAVGDDTRAQAIRAMLSCMNSKSTVADVGAYEEVSRNLQELWNTALAQAEAGQQTVRSKADNATAKAVVEALWNVLEKCECGSFHIPNWEQVQRQSLNDVLIDKPLLVGELRTVFNIIWRARTDPANLGNMEEVARKVRDRILKKRESGRTAAQSPNLPIKVTSA